MANKLSHITVNTTAVQTTNNTITTVHTWNPSPIIGSSNYAILSVTGTLVGKGVSLNGVSMIANATFVLNSGTVTLLGSQTTIMAPQGSAALTPSVITIDTSSNIIRIRVTGIAATTINWVGYIAVKTSEF